MTGLSDWMKEVVKDDRLSKYNQFGIKWKF